ncbi:MAG: hypothetical protein Q4A32_05390 [Lachnospiraceae bacterium]|nr:hypothetical protein [Lachnospiraceae bacterium]
MDDRKKAELTEKYMPLAMRLAAQMDDGIMPLEDLTQEAFVGLVAGLNILERYDEDAKGMALDDVLERAIREQILIAKEEQQELIRRDDRLLVQAELLNRSIDSLTETLGTKPTVDEVANDMGVSQEVVMDILKLMGETLPEGDEYKENREYWADNPTLRKFI